MAYNANIPQSTDYLNDSQGQILANFQALAPWGLGYGQFTLQGSAPTFSSGVDGLYVLTNATTTANEMYIHLQRVSPGNAPTDIPFTAAIMSNTAIAGCTSGWSYLPSGLLIKWGEQSITTASTFTRVTVGATSGGPNFNQIFQYYAVAYNVGAYVAASAGVGGIISATAGDFQAYLTAASANTGVSYLVIGV